MGAEISSYFYEKTLTENPWRQPASFNKKLEEELILEISELKPTIKPSVLFVGPTGAGKSSFINSALSVSCRRKVAIVSTGASPISFTTNYQQYWDRSFLKNYRFRDTMGIQRTEQTGLHLDDMVKLLKGHIKDKYKFDPMSSIDESNNDFIRNPTVEDQIHCVVFVIDAAMITPELPKDYIRRIGRVQEEVKNLGIPRVLLLTKMDKLCEEVEKSTSKMFYSIKVEKCVKLASEIFNISKGSIHPVKNYEDDIQLDTETNIPILLALRQMLQYADDKAWELAN